ncbi:hypothetical protein ACAG39_03255 [Caldicellulosiruptoraceae bacterium PP1]
MSLIPCTYDCRYQKDGLCFKTQITSPSNLHSNKKCLFFEPINNKENKKFKL